MNHVTIRSKYHIFLDAYKADRIMVAMGKNVYRTAKRLRHFDKTSLDDYLMIGRGELATIPRYIFSDETKPIIHSRETMETIEVLKKFGRYRLPHPMCVAEYPGDNPGIRLFAFCYEKKEKSLLRPGDTEFPFYVTMFALYDLLHPDMTRIIKEKAGTIKDQYFAILYPVMAEMENIPTHEIGEIDTKNTGGVRYKVGPVPWIAIDRMDDIPEAPFNRDEMVREYVMQAGFAIRALTSMLQTRGVCQDAVSAADVYKINKKREAARASKIPTHVYVSLGKKFSGKTASDTPGQATGRKLRCHMRSAHTKTQRFGPGLSQAKEIMIEAYLVNGDGQDLYNPIRVVKP